MSYVSLFQGPDRETRIENLKLRQNKRPLTHEAFTVAEQSMIIKNPPK